jgi:hypothetical protein
VFVHNNYRGFGPKRLFVKRIREKDGSWQQHRSLMYEFIRDRLRYETASTQRFGEHALATHFDLRQGWYGVSLCGSRAVGVILAFSIGILERVQFMVIM